MIQRLLLIIIAIAVGPPTGCGQAPGSSRPSEVFSLAGETMGTRYAARIVGLDTAHGALEQLQAAIDERLEQIEQRMSTWRNDSELSRFNRHAETGWFAVSPDTAQVIDTAIRIGRQSGGAFDVTVGRLVSLWQFGPRDSQRDITSAMQPPGEGEIAAAREALGIDKIEVRFDPPAVRKADAGVTVDLSGIAKGFAVDELAVILEQWGASAYLVEIGGEIRARGLKPDGTCWRVGIEQPDPTRRAVGWTLELSNAAIATSGDYRNFRDVGGRRVSHTIDPVTGRPVEHRLASASVVGSTCMEADAWATALMVMGPDKGHAWAVKHDLAALLIERSGDGFREKTTPRFDRLFPAAARSRSATVLLTAALAGLVFIAAAAGMAIGRIRNRCLRGTCGGMAGLTDAAGRPICHACGSGDEQSRTAL